jgi:hypothetical protein
LSTHLRLGIPCGLFPSGFASNSYISVSQPVVRDDGTGGPQADLN